MGFILNMAIWAIQLAESGENARSFFSVFLSNKCFGNRSGYHIFWVARMIIASLEIMGPDKKSLTDAEIEERIPFKNVHFTGIIRDKLGRKMLKSLGEFAWIFRFTC